VESKEGMLLKGVNAKIQALDIFNREDNGFRIKRRLCPEKR